MWKKLKLIDQKISLVKKGREIKFNGEICMTGCISGVICGIAFTEIKVSKFLNLRKQHVEKIKLIDQKNV